jgi:hypothetical protein
VGPKTGVDAMEKRKCSYPCRKWNPGLLHIARKYVYLLSYPGSFGSYNEKVISYIPNALRATRHIINYISSYTTPKLQFLMMDLRFSQPRL